VEQLGAGLSVAPNRPDHIAQQLNNLLSARRFAEGAQRFASRYENWDSKARMDEMAECVEKLL
jgi:hypothetical protein